MNPSSKVRETNGPLREMPQKWRELLQKPAREPWPIDMILVAVGSAMLILSLLIPFLQLMDTNTVAIATLVGLGTTILVAGLYYGFKWRTLSGLLAWTLNVQTGLELFSLTYEDETEKNNAKRFRDSADRIQKASQILLDVWARGRKRR